MPTSQDWHVVIIGGPVTIRHRRAAKPRKIAMGIIADRAPLAKLSRWRCMAIAISMAGLGVVRTRFRKASGDHVRIAE
jgi:hypothetical protein